MSSLAQDVELDLLVEGIYRVYGYDFRNYARASLKRRMLRQMANESVTTLSALQERILHDEAALKRLLKTLSIHVTSMFRDPGFFQSLRDNVIPILRTYPSLQIWVAGCSTGEEVHSLAILLHEEGLYERSRIYATDISDRALQTARVGAYPLEQMQQHTSNYQASGAKASFSEYYRVERGRAVFEPRLRDNVTFSVHNLATDASFNEFQLILCRNVMIYFDPILQARTIELFRQSLCLLGILGLGKQETVRAPEQRELFEALDNTHRIYRRKR